MTRTNRDRIQALGLKVKRIKFTESFSILLSKTSPGVPFFEKLNDVNEVNNASKAQTLVETFSDSDWQGGRDLKGTSAACHFW